MAMMSKTRNMLEGLVRDSSFRWALGRRSSFDEEFEEMGRSPSGRRKWISELSPVANVVVGRCSRVLDMSMDDLQLNFNAEASESLKQPTNYARNFLEYCCFRALALSAQGTGYLADKTFRRLSYDMMLAWEAPSSASELVGMESTVGLEAFSRIATAIPAVADVVTCFNLFDVLTSSIGGRLTFAIYDKYLGGLDRAIQKMKAQSESSLLSSFRVLRGERVIDVDGTLTTQPVLEHVGISTWPGRLTLTDHALYFEALRVMTYDKPKIYDLQDDLKQVIKPELTGPWGSRLFDKAVLYKSMALSEPAIIEFPELTGHSRRDYWLVIMREVLYMHQFIRKYQLRDGMKEETILKAVLGILRLQSIHDLSTSATLRYETLLMFNLAYHLPGGDLILETLSSTIRCRSSDRSNRSPECGMHSPSASSILSNLGLVSAVSPDDRLLVGEIAVGETTPLESVINESLNSYKMVEKAQATIDGVKVDGIDTNLAVMKELLNPIIELGKIFMSLALWDDPFKSLTFCCLSCYIILRGWLGYAIVLGFLFIASFMLLTRFFNQGRTVDQIKVIAPPPLNTMEQLLAVQNAVSQVEEMVQDANIILLKIRSLLLAVSSQATDRAMVAIILVAITVAFLPGRLMILLLFLETFTTFSPPRRTITERWMRRLREWWFSIPAAPVVVERENKEDKKK